MGKYQSYMRQPERKKEAPIHPVWRGIGFILMIMIPIMSYAGTLVLLDANRQQGWISIPPNLLAPGPEPLLYVKIIVTVFLMILLFGIFSLLTFIIYRIFAPPRYGPFDAPPVRYRGGRYKR
jgi:hypothetical protein